MDFYPAGLELASHPFAGKLPEKQVLAPVGDGLVLPPQRDPLLDDMDFLERVLRECHLSEPSSGSPPDAPRPREPAAAAPMDQAHLAAAPAAAAGADAREGAAAAAAAVAPWAEELVRRLQGCQSAEVAKDQCAELLMTFAQDCQARVTAPAIAAQEQRLQKLQFANGILLKGFRSLYQRLQSSEARCRHAEEQIARVSAQLQQCQEELRSSERAKAALQYHLQLTNTGPPQLAGL